MLSIVQGPTSRPLNYGTIFEALRLQVTRAPDEIAVISDHERISRTFAELSMDVVRMANCFRTKLNLDIGDHVAIWSNNCYAYIVIQLAASAAGVTLWLFDSCWTARELGHALELSEAKVLFMPGANSPQNVRLDYLQTFEALANCHRPRTVFLDGHTSPILSTLVHGCSSNVLSFKTHPQCHDPYLVIFTSGSTGSPKAAVLSQFAVLNNYILVNGRVPHSGGKRYCCPLPLYHSFAAMGTVTGIAAIGTCLVLTGYKYSVRACLDAMVRHRCTNLAAVPTMVFDAVVAIEANELQLPDWRGLFTAGAASSTDVLRRLTQLVPSLTNVTVAYGATELACAASVSTPADGLVFNHAGRVLDHVQLKLVHLETGQVVPIGQRGLVLVQSPFTMSGYHKDDLRSREAFDASGWYITGDIARLDEEGHVTLVGRCKELIVRAGEKIHPLEIEEALRGHPDVLSSVAFAVPDKRLGEQVCAWVSVSPGAKLAPKDVKTFLATRLAGYKIPHYVIISERATPLTGSGKVAKRVLVSSAMELLGLS